MNFVKEYKGRSVKGHVHFGIWTEMKEEGKREEGKM